MRPAQILHELNAMGLYTEEEWQEYLGLLDETVRVELEGLRAGAATGELHRRVCGHHSASSGVEVGDTSPKIVAIDELVWMTQRGDAPIVMVSGAYDLLHLGHLRSFREAGRLAAGMAGGVLCAMTLSDEHIRAKKGPDRPVLCLAERLAMIAAVRAVDHVVPLTWPDCLAAIERLRPKLFCKSEADLSQPIVNAEIALVCQLGGRLAAIAGPEPRPLTTTSLIDTILRRQQCG